MKRRRNHHKLICLARLDATCNFIKCIIHWVLLLTWATTVFANHVHNVKSNNRSLPITSMATVTSLLLSTDNVATTLHPSLADHRHHFSSTTPSSLSIVNLSSDSSNANRRHYGRNADSHPQTPPPPPHSSSLSQLTASDPISETKEASVETPETLMNRKYSGQSAKLLKRYSKLDQDFTPPIEHHSSTSNSKDLFRNQPSSMDDIIGGLLQLMGGNLKMPPGQKQQTPKQQTDISNKLASLLSQMGGPNGQVPHQRIPPHLAHLLPRPQNGNNMPNLPGFVSLPNIAKNRQPANINYKPPSNFPLYKIPFIPLMPNNGRPAIPLNGQQAGSLPPKLPPNFPVIQGLNKAEMDALYSQFLASGGMNKTNILTNLMNMSKHNKKTPNIEPSIVDPISTSLLIIPSSSWSTFDSPDNTITPFGNINPTSAEEPQIITMQEEPSIFEMIVKHKLGPSVSESSTISLNQKSKTSILPINPTRTVDNRVYQTVNPSTSLSTTNEVSITEIRNQHNQHQKPPKKENTDIVYGKRIPSVSKPNDSSISVLSSSVAPSFSSVYPQMLPTKTEVIKSITKMDTTTTTVVGKPMVMPVEMDSVNPRVGPIKSTSIEPTRTIESTRQTSQSKSYDISVKHTNKQNQTQPAKKSHAKPYIRRPSFRPRPNVPIVRIDTCIVGDDSTCEVSLNEKCLTELGLSSCQCKPGYARQIPRTACVPVISLAISFRVDRMGGNKVLFSRPLLNPNSEEYQYLEYESIHAMNSLFSGTKTLSTDLMGVKVNRFYSVGGKTIVNATINLRSNETSVNGHSTKRLLQQELTHAIASSNNNLGESQLWVESNANAITRVEDLNECATSDLNDCSKHARCYNDFGGFRCECEPGYDDKFANDVHKAGRVCSTCSPQYCSNRGECMIVKGEKVCKCRANFIGAQCDIDAEVLGVAVGGSIAALIIIVITFICLYMWNQRFKHEQQKIEAMSAASGHTFSYVNKHNGPPTISRMSIDDRYGRSWATHYSDSQQHLLSSNGTNYYGMNSDQQVSTTSPQHVYAQPVRVIPQNTDHGTYEPTYNTHQTAYSDYARNGMRSLKVKGRNERNITSGGSLHYPYSLKQSGESNFNETEFSTRELIYSPAHLYSTNTRTSHGYY